MARGEGGVRLGGGGAGLRERVRLGHVTNADRWGKQDAAERIGGGSMAESSKIINDAECR